MIPTQTARVPLPERWNPPSLLGPLPSFRVAFVAAFKSTALTQANAAWRFCVTAVALPPLPGMSTVRIGVIVNMLRRMVSVLKSP